jgi:hypothetical protein
MSAGATGRRQLVPFAALVGELLRPHRLLQSLPAAVAQRAGFRPVRHQRADLGAGGHAAVCALRLGLAERPHRRAREAAALWCQHRAAGLAGTVVRAEPAVAGRGAAGDVHPHQFDDADERGRHGAPGQPGRRFRRPALRPRAAVGLAGLPGHGVCGRGLVRARRHGAVSGLDHADAGGRDGQRLVPPGSEGGHPRPRGQGAGAAGAAPARGVMVFCGGVFPCAVTHRHLCLLLAVSGFAGLQQDHDRPAVGGVGDRGDRLVFHPVPLAADAEPDRLAGAVLCSHGAAHGHHGQQRQRAGRFAAGAGAARLHLCHAPHGVHRAAVAPLPLAGCAGAGRRSTPSSPTAFRACWEGLQAGS